MSEWIPCSERLPGVQYDGKILEARIAPGIGPAKQGLAGYSYEHRKGSNWFDPFDGRALGGITHWMPPPEGPGKGVRDERLSNGGL